MEIWDMRETTVVVVAKTGLHARPAAVVVEKVSCFDSVIRLSIGDRDANAKSLVSLLTLGASFGAEVTIRVDGPDEEAALSEILSLSDIFRLSTATGTGDVVNGGIA